MTVDISKIRPGDEVTVRATVVDLPGDHWNSFRLRYEHPEALRGEGLVNATHDIPSRSIVSHTPKALSVGDRVQVNFAEGPIVAIHGRYAWVDLGAPDGHPSTWILSDLERIP